MKWIISALFLLMSFDSLCATEEYLASAQWRCKRCKQYIWVEDPDWRGNYYCPGCGTKMGEE